MISRFEHFTLDIFQISRYWNKIATEEMKKHELKGAYAIYLVTIGNSKEGITAARLAEVCARDKADVSRAIAAFEARGMAERVGGQNYRANLRLTAKGQELVSEIRERAGLVLDYVSRNICEEKREIMYECLDTISENLRDLSQEGLPG